jgi:hypothetical protein
MTELFGIAGWADYRRCVFSGLLFFPVGPRVFISGLTRDFVRTGVLDFVLGCFLSPFGAGFGGVGIGVTGVFVRMP